MRLKQARSNPQRIVIVGASSAIAQNCARIWGGKEEVVELILVARNAARLKRVARDLQVRHPPLTGANWSSMYRENGNLSCG